MVQFEVLVEVWLKEGLVDAEGQSVKEALKDLGYPVLDTRVGKVYRLILEAESEKRASEIVDELCKRLLANPVKDRYSFKVRKL